MSHIGTRIFAGETAEQIGIPDAMFGTYKALVDRFVAGWSGGDFDTDFQAWLESGAHPGVQIDARHTAPNGPSVVTRVKNFSGALFRFVVEGMPIESKEEATRRLEICESNACGHFDGSVCRHTKCGCFSKIKTFFATEHCPVDRW